MPSRVYLTGINAIFDGTIDLDSDTLGVALMDAEVYVEADEFLSDIATPVATETLTGAAVSGQSLLADNTPFAGVSGSDILSIVVFKDTGSPATSTLICCMDAAGDAMLVPTGGDVEIAWNGGVVITAHNVDYVEPGYGLANYLGTDQDFVVPAGVTTIHVVMAGAEGVTGGAAAVGGTGAVIEFDMAVTPGETLELHVGGSDTSGYNGAGAPNAAGGGWGGGASDIRQGGSALTDRVAIAGGGGGGGSGGTFGEVSGLGGKAGISGSNGTGGSGGASSGTGGYGATTSAGGTYGGPMDGTAGTLGQGGSGGGNGGSRGRGGGGGGGYYGGGGGGGNNSFSWSTGGGGGGGSCLIPAFGSLTSDTHTGDGYIEITWGG